MDRVTVVIIVLAVLAAGSAAVYFLWNRRRRAKRLTMELLKGYFHGDIDARQFARRMRESGDYGFTGGAQFYALVTGAFQRAADAQLPHHSHTKEVESKLLRSLAALKEEFGLPDCYRIEAGRPGRE
jgi:hypothetical protein